MTCPETEPIDASGDSARSPRSRRVEGSLKAALRTLGTVRKSLRRAMAAAGGPRPGLARVLHIYRREGLLGVRRGLALLAAQGERLPNPQKDGFAPGDYQAWIARYDTLGESERRGVLRAIERLRRARANGLPKLSVLLVDGDQAQLKRTLLCLRGQLYPDWELLPALTQSSAAAQETISRYTHDDRRIRACCPGETPAQALSAALGTAQGELLVFLRAGDEMPPQAFFCLAEALCAEPQGALAYSDEDSLEDSGLGGVARRSNPQFKPDFDPELLVAGGLPLGLWGCRATLARKAGGPREGFGPLTAEELGWRVLEAPGVRQAVHVRRVLLNRSSLAPGRAPQEFEYGLRMSRERLARLSLHAEVSLAPDLPWGRRVRYQRPGPEALVSIIIPTRDRADLLGACLHSLLERTAHTGYEILVVDNGSKEEATFQLFSSLPPERVRVLRDDLPFNFSRLNNVAARQARGAYLCMLNNDIEVIDGDWLGELLSFAVKPEVGCVGARLWYPDGTLQHGGIIVGLGGSAGHAHRKLTKSQAGYCGRALLAQSMSAVTAACLLVRRDVFNAVGGLDENLPESYNDVDFCLRVQAAGYRNIWTPFAELTHRESATRRDRTGGHAQRMKEFDRQATLIMRTRRSVLAEDPAYNPNLTRLGDDFALAWPPRVAPLALL
jgi:O-antigen biosynthesis protein